MGGAVLGVIAMLATLFGLVWAVEDHFVPRAEYAATVSAIRAEQITNLALIRADLADIRTQIIVNRRELKGSAR